MDPFPRYDISRSYDWNYDHPPDPRSVEVPAIPGEWSLCGRQVDSPLGIPAGPLLNGAWCLYYASLGFDVITYKTVRSGARACYPLPNLQPVQCERMSGGEANVSVAQDMLGSWAVSFGMPSKSPKKWQQDVQRTRDALPREKLLVVSAVGTMQENWTIDDLADDYARCGRLAVDSGADFVEINFSCPNVTTCDGQLYQQPADSGLVANRVRQAIGDVPLIVKIGHLTDERTVSELIQHLSSSAQAIAMTNSIATQVLDEDKSVMFDGQVRGICGAATRQASLSQVEMFAREISSQEVPVEIIGVGGIGSAEDVREYLAAGAKATHLATSAMLDPAIALSIRRDWRS